MATSNSSKKVVQSNAQPAETPGWQPRPEDRAKANRQRLIAIVLWVVSIAIECVTIFALMLRGTIQTKPLGGGDYVERHPFLWMELSQNAYFAWLIVLIVICGALAIVGSQLWKKANKADPASEKNKLRFFVQNQLGMILAMIAFIPLLILVIMDKNLKGAQKGVAIGVAAVVLVATTFFGTEFNPSSSEQYGTEQQFVTSFNAATRGVSEDVVYWVKGGSTYHLCQDSSDLQQDSKDNQIYAGTVGQAHAAGMDRLAWRNECGFDNTLTNSAGEHDAVDQWLASHPSGSNPATPPNDSETPR